MLSLICGDGEVVASILEPMRKSAISKAKLVLARLASSFLKY
jgi:hypothetical protein